MKIFTMALAVMISTSSGNFAAQLGTAFTYQGRLQQSGDAALGTVDFQCSLWDAAVAGNPPVGGAQIGATQTVTDVSVFHGLFTVQLNAGGEFGTTAFNGEARWLQIAVRKPAGSGPYTTLAPRQPLTVAPYAAHAAGPWVTTGTAVTYSGGNVGIGTSPQGKLHVAGSVRSDGDLRAVNPNDTAAEVFLGWGADAGGADVARIRIAGDGPGASNGLDIQRRGNASLLRISGDGNVGIGTITPTVKLEVHSETGRAGKFVSDAGQALWAIGDHDNDAAAAFVNLGDGPAGNFQGDVRVLGNLFKASGSFRIDHPLDPANKYLQHSFVESPDMMNIYNGNVFTDERGYATVTMPEWFEALNRDFRYQLTVIGQFAQAIVSEELRDGRFCIRTDKPAVKVSWQVTGIRQDAWANAHRVQVEQDKAETDRGKYLAPELFGEPKD